MRLVAYQEDAASRWDSFLAKTAQGVMLHSRHFLAYHGGRFRDLSLVIENDKGQLRALFPAAEALDDPACVVSHPGLTYGGLLHDSGCRADEVMEMLDAVAAWYRGLGYRRLLYKALPHHVQRMPVQSDLYALWRAGALVVRRDLWNILDLRLPRSLSKGHSWSAKKAAKAGLDVCRLEGDEYGAFHAILAEGLKERYGTRPVHDLGELLDLQARFPEAIELWGCRSPAGDLIAGVWLFKLHDHCWHTQYIAANQAGRDVFATDLLLEHLVARAKEAGAAYFSFGNSTDDGGKNLNSGLFSFKAGFGAGAAIQDFYEVTLHA